MPRTIDSIVESHRAARTLRAAGRPAWTYHADIKQILRDNKEATDEMLVDAATRIAAALRRVLPARLFDVTSDDYDMAIDEIVEDFESYTVDSLVHIRAEGIESQDMFDGRLDELYDWADANRLWLG